MNKLKAILIGAGGRGFTYADFILQNHNDEIEFISVADPNEIRKNKFGDKHNISDDLRFTDWKDVVEREKFADVVFICTQDQMHVEPATACLNLKYNVVLEKPMAVTPEDCIYLGELAKQNDCLFAICHVLRYSNLYVHVKKMIDDGVIGKVENIEHAEQVWNWHHAHSFVRGNWRNSSESSPMILAKCCHDMDLLSWFTDSKCKKISSFGSLSYFKSENAPKGATKRCLDGCPHLDTCYYNCEKIYLNEGFCNWLSWAISEDQSYEGKRKALETGPYGRCVFYCDNDVVDKQIVAIEFENGCVATHTMSAFNKPDRRTTFMGTKGMLQVSLENNCIEHYDFATLKTTKIEPKQFEGGHGGSDQLITKGIVDTLMGRAQTKTGADISVQSHLMAFAAEKSRLEGKTIDYDKYVEEIKSSL